MSMEGNAYSDIKPETQKKLIVIRLANKINILLKEFT